MADRSSAAAPPGPAAWIHDGVAVWYERSPFHVNAGVVNGEPRLLGTETWVVGLREMDLAYRHAEGRSTVRAVACDRLRPRETMSHG